MDLNELSKEFRFAACFTFTTEPFEHYEKRLREGSLHWAADDLSTDISKEAPWANAILLLIYPYKPFRDDVPVSGNYPASNAAYHASGKMMRRLNDNGVRTERGEVPIRELLTRNGVGTPLKNGLTYLPGFGTRYSAQALLCALPETVYMPVQPKQEARCEGCHACERICPSNAISDSGYDYTACARAYMGSDPMEDWVMDSMTCILGCELCQRICPYNFVTGYVDDVPEAFRLEEILSGKIKPVLEIVGKNLNKKGRVIQHACVIAAKQGRTDLIPLIEKWCLDEREGVRVAADYALKKLRT